MSWPTATWIPGSVFTAAQGNAYLRDTLTDLRAGGIAQSGQAAHDLVVTASATQWTRVAGVPNKIPQFTGATWQMVHPLEVAWPVGSVYKAMVSTNPATVLGFGTWTFLGPGRATVCVDTSDPDFDAALKTGGSKTVTLSIAELPSHTHVQDAHNHTQNAHAHSVLNCANDTFVDSGAAADAFDDSGTKVTESTTATNNAATAVNQSTGGGGAHNNMPPFHVQYRWARTA